MNRKRKVGRPKKINYTPKIELIYSDTLFWDIMKIKRQLGMPLTIGELNGLVNRDLIPYGFKAVITITNKLKWYQKVLQWFKRNKTR